MSETEPTPDIVPRLFAGETEETLGEPILQMLSCKKVPNNSGKQDAADRYRLILSDGTYFVQSMLATNQNDLVTSQAIDRYTLIRLNKWAMNTVNHRKLVVVIACEPVGQLDYKHGDPQSIEGTIKPAAAKPTETNDNGDVDMPDAAAARPNAANANRIIGNSRGGAAGARNGGGVQSRSNNKSGGSGLSAPIYPIEGLSPYQNKWTIKARVTAKSDIRQWSNAKGEGKLFSVTLMDETGEIKATGFNDAVDKLYPILEENKVYFISKARINIAKKQFNNVNNEYEITFNNDSEVELCTDTENVPQLRFSFVKLDGLNDLEKDATCDVIGIVKDVGEIGTIVSKATSRPITKRELNLVDESGYSIRLTLWGKTAENFVANDSPVMAFRGVRVGDFGGRSLSMVSSSTMLSEPDIPEAHSLRGWFDTQGSASTFTAYQNTGAGASAGGSFKPQESRTIGQVRDEGYGLGETPQYFNMIATVVYIKADNFAYPACPADRCNKKLVMEGNDSWRCEKCDQSYEKPEYRYILSASVSDFTGQIWLSGFNESGQLIVGVSADKANDLKNEDEAEFRKVMQSATGKMWNFSCRAKADTYNEQMKVRYQIVGCKTVDWVAAGKQLVEKIAAYGVVPNM